MFLYWEQRAGLVDVKQSCEKHGKGMQCMALVSKGNRKDESIPSTLLSPLFSLLPVSFRKRDWMLDADLLQCGLIS